jgi:tol-pal system protein YbgF
VLGAKPARALRRAPVAVRLAHRQWLALAVLGAAAAGCATQADVQFVREDVAAARKQAADAKAMVDSLKVDVESLRGEIETLKYQGGGGGGAKLDDLNRRLDALDARVAAIEQSRAPVAGAPPSGGEVPAAVAPTPGPTEGPFANVQIPASAPAEYRDGIGLLQRGDNAGAIQKLREFLRKSPKSDLADDAQYWIGEAYYANRDYNRAILEFNEVLLRYPKGDKVPAALLRQAGAFAELGDKVDARLVLQKLVSEHGDSPEAEKGRQKLAELSS